MSGISRDDVLHVARLSALEVPEAELDHLVAQLKSIVAMVEQLNEVTVAERLRRSTWAPRRPSSVPTWWRPSAGAPAGGDGPDCG
jgi:Asp-tRNA(Asn)/Glu-tRNA(Gln) amidotransferase C subunit